jgi:parallel beta-helix repeat protein
MDSIKVALFSLILGFLLTSIAAPISPDKLIDGTRLRWNNITGVQNEGYSENNLDWYTYKITIDGSKSTMKSASKKTTIEKDETLNFRWKMDSIVDDANLIFKIGTSEQRSCSATDWKDNLSSIQVRPGDEIQWIFMNLNPSQSAQAWIAIAPGSASPNDNQALPIPETPSGPNIGYTNQSYSFSMNSIESSEDIDYQFEFDGHPSNQTKEAKDTKIWASPGQKRVRARAINRNGNAGHWSQPKTVVIFEQINVMDHLQDTINNHTSYAELVLLKDQNNAGELVIGEKNNITLISSNGNKFKLAGPSAQSRVKIINSENISIQQLIISNPGGEGIKLENSHYCTISNNDIQFGLRKRGISIIGNNNTINDNILRNHTGACSAYSEGIVIEKGENNKILNNNIERNKNCIVSSYILNTTGPFKIAVSNLDDFPVVLFIGYREPNSLCGWYINGTIICANRGNGDDIYRPYDSDRDAYIWSTFERSNQ